MAERHPFKVVMLCRDDDTARIMYHGLVPDWDIVGVIIEQKPSTRQMLQRRIRKLGIWTVLGQVLFMLYTRLVGVRLAKPAREALLSAEQVTVAAFPSDKVRHVASANDSETIRLLQAWNPDAVVVNGTRILSPSVLSSVSGPFINTHAGITPRYRGVHGGYWALARHDAAHCGVTVHLVDEGIDTGSVLYQAVIEVGPDDSFVTYPLRQVIKAAPLMSQALSDVKHGRLRPQVGVGPSGLWSHPTLWEYLANWLRSGVK